MNYFRKIVFNFFQLLANGSALSEEARMDKKNSGRLGEILLEKGLITSEQLDSAVNEQIKRRQRAHPLDSHSRQSTSLGEILIELGYIDRLQLNRGLNWQLILRKMTLVMSLCAPLMTASFGAAAVSSSPTSAASSKSSTTSSKPSSSSSSRLVIVGTNVSSKSSVSSRASSSSRSSIASSKPSSSTSSSSSSVKAVAVAGPVALSWAVPIVRENGDYLDITELGGYELRYRLATVPQYTYVTINDPWINYQNFPWLVGNYVFQIAAFDKNGVYSNFVNITPH